GPSHGTPGAAATAAHRARPDCQAHPDHQAHQDRRGRPGHWGRRPGQARWSGQDQQAPQTLGGPQPYRVLPYVKRYLTKEISSESYRSERTPPLVITHPLATCPTPPLPPPGPVPAPPPAAARAPPLLPGSPDLSRILVTETGTKRT